jgi:hypothetical protein
LYQPNSNSSNRKAFCTSRTRIQAKSCFTNRTRIQAIGKHFVPAALEFKQKVVLQIALEFKQSEKMVEWRTVETLLQQPGRQSFIDAYQMITAIDKQKHSPSGLSNIQ